MSIPAIVGDVVTLVEVLPDGSTDVYPQAEVYEPGNPVPVATVDLAHLANGCYESSWTPSSVGSYLVLYIVYSDVAHSVESVMYPREAEQIFVTQTDSDDLAVKILRLLGLNMENAFIDQTTYDPNGMLLTARLRIFDTKAHLDAATESGVGEAGTIAEYTGDSEHYGPNQLRWMKMGKL